MPDAPNFSTPHEHIYTTDVRTWEKAKAYARENRKAPTRGYGRSCEPLG